MREKDIRDRIEKFLKGTVRTVVVPASMGIGLSLSGCGDSSALNLDASADTGTGSLYQADSGSKADLPAMASEDAAAILDASGLTPVDGSLASEASVAQDDAATKYSAVIPDAGKSDLPAIVPPYMAVLPGDASTGPEVGVRYAAVQPDAGRPELPAVQPDYMAVLPTDAGSAVTRYGALMRDAGLMTPVYSAPVPPKGISG